MAQRILVSWVSPRYDFTEKNGHQPNKKGINYQFHFHHFAKMGYDKHILFSTKSKNDKVGDQGLMELMSLLRQDFGHEVEARFLDIKDPISLEEIKPKVERELLELLEHEVHIFYNPGYQMMQLAWYICHTSSCKNTKLFHVRKAEYSPSGIPEVLFLDVKSQKSHESFYLLLKDQALTKDTTPSATFMVSTLQKTYDRADAVAHIPYVNTLIMGDSGTGKEALARYIHDQTPAISGDFYAVNCAAFSDELLRSELFGHKRGAFTGAINDKEGFFEKANGGTLFLDEIGDISPFTQKTLLRVLQEGTFERVGCTITRHSKVRVVAATNKPLFEIVSKEKHHDSFRLDLYHRLSVGMIRTPSWQEYSLEEREKFIYYFLEQYAREYNQKRVLILEKVALKALIINTFPGNIRQLKNLIFSLYIFYRNAPKITLANIREELGEKTQPTQQFLLKMEDVEREHIGKVLRIFEGNKSRACKALGYGSINTLIKKIDKYNLGSKS